MNHDMIRTLIGRGMISPDLADRYVRGMLPVPQAQAFEAAVAMEYQKYENERRNGPAGVPISKIRSGAAQRDHEEYERQRMMQQAARYPAFDPNPFASGSGITMDKIEQAKALVMSGLATKEQLDVIIGLEGKKPSRVINKTLYLKF